MVMEMHITQGLLEVLLELAAERAPMDLEVDLTAMPAGELDGEHSLDESTPVLTHFDLPTTGNSVSAVFGFDLGSSPGRADGRFISHPAGDLDVRPTDELHAMMLIAIPPWDRESVAAFDRSGRRQVLTVVDAEPPAESLP